jgi:hypothetical protein
MSATYILIAAVLIMVVMGTIMGVNFARQQGSKRREDQYGSEYDHSAQAAGNGKKKKAELDAQQKHTEK